MTLSLWKASMLICAITSQRWHGAADVFLENWRTFRRFLLFSFRPITALVSRKTAIVPVTQGLLFLFPSLISFNCALGHSCFDGSVRIAHLLGWSVGRCFAWGPSLGGAPPQGSKGGIPPSPIPYRRPPHSLPVLLKLLKADTPQTCRCRRAKLRRGCPVRALPRQAALIRRCAAAPGLPAAAQARPAPHPPGI